MQMNTRAFWVMTTFFLLAVATYCRSVLAYDDKTISEANAAYEDGYNKFKNNDWYEAAEHLKISYFLIPFPKTAYLISVAYSKVYDTRGAREFATHSLKGIPPLEQGLRDKYRLKEPYISGANELIKWAQEYDNSPSVLMGSADCPTCPSPPSPPSNLRVPSETQLPLKLNSVVGPIAIGDKIIQQSDLTGAWRCNDGGVYFIRQVGNKVWWLGQSGDNGKSWSNVFQGTIIKDTIRGEWADIPSGKARNFGGIILKIESPKQLIAISKSGGFGGSDWRR